MLNCKTRLHMTLTVIVFVIGTTAALAQDETPVGGWQKEIKVGVNMLQSSYSNNWNGGEKGSVAWTGNVDARLEKQFSPTANWRNSLKLAYGQTHNQGRNDGGELYWIKPDKTDDIVDFESFFRWTLPSKWDPYVALNFTSQFQDLSDSEARELNFNPKTFKESAGISRRLVNNEQRKLMTRVGVAFIQNSRTFYVDPLPSLETLSESSNEIAAEWITEAKVGVLNDRVGWESKLTLVLPFQYSGKATFEDGFISAEPVPDDIADYTTALDVDWENTFSANITKVISVKLFVRWMYDKYDNTVKPVVGEDGTLVNEENVLRAVRKAGQFKQTLALGVGYTFN